MQMRQDILTSWQYVISGKVKLTKSSLTIKRGKRKTGQNNIRHCKAKQNVYKTIKKSSQNRNRFHIQKGYSHMVIAFSLQGKKEKCVDKNENCPFLFATKKIPEYIIRGF